jgi:DNA-binding transcriptional LysR family regulator
MTKIHIRQVETFRAVVTLRSMTKAAEYLGISQPAVSRLIADFQETVGFKLFKRGRNSAEPTSDAMLLFEQVDKLFYGLEELGRQVDAINNMRFGRLVISATSSYAVGFLPELIAAFKRENANVEVAFHIQSHEQVIDWVSTGRADIGFAIQPIARSELTTLTIGSRDAHCIFPLGHPLEAKDLLRLRDLANLPFVSFPRGTPLRFLIDGLFDRAGVHRLLHAEATSHHAVCALVSSGLGVALVNPFAPIEGYSNKLVARPMKPSVTMEIQMMFNERSLSLTSTRFKDFVIHSAPAVFANQNKGEIQTRAFKSKRVSAMQSGGGE